MSADVSPKLPSGEAERLLGEVLDSTEHIIYRANFVRGGYDYISRAATAIFGIDEARIRAEGLSLLAERMAPEDYQRCVAHFTALARSHPGTATPTRVEYRITLPDGRVACFADDTNVEADADGQLVAVFGITTDISEQRRVQAQLAENSRLLSDFFSQSLDGCFVLRFPSPVDWSQLSPSGETQAIASLCFVRANDAFCVQCGFATEDILEAAVDRFPARLPAEWQRALWRCLGGHPHSCTMELRHPNDAAAWVEMQLLPDVSDDGRMLGIFGVQRDITQRIANEAELRESDEKYSSTMRSAQVGIFMLQNQKFVFVNPRLAGDFGYSEDELLRGMGPLDLVAPEQHAYLLDQMRRRAAGEPGMPYELTGLRRDGSRFPIMIFGSPSTYRGLPASVGTVFDLTAQRIVEDEITASRNRYRALFEGAQDAIVLIDGASEKVIDANVEAELLFRHPKEELVGALARNLFPEPRREKFDLAFRRLVALGGGEPEELFILSADGHEVPAEVSTSMLEMGGGRRVMQAIFRDITARRRTEANLRLIRRVFEVSEEVIVITDAERRIVTVNPAFSRVTGYSEDEVRGQNPRLMQSGKQSDEFYESMWQAIDRDGVWQGELWNRRKDGEVYPVWLSISAYRNAEGQVINYVGISSDISERHAAEARIRELAYYDPLTRLPNRTLLHDRVNQALAKGAREGKVVALMFIDLDHFKTINDSLGHFTGDQLLVEVGRRMSECVRRTDTVARLGGDEFVIVLVEASIEGSAEVARKLIDSVSLPYRVDAHDLTVTPSIGISLFPQDGGDFETLLKHADTAMYRAKESGRNAYQFFAREMNVAALERLVLENSMRQGLERREFELHYQPQIELATGRIVGAEALIRWRHPEIGLVSPMKFIPVAEASGLIVPLGAWVLREACRQTAVWRAEGITLTMAVNISAAQFKQENFETSVAEILKASDLPSGCLELELTESSVMEDAETTIATLRRLSATGVCLAIDDFGTGYSSLSYLKRFPIDKLKIDQSFVRDIVTDADDWAIASTVMSMGRNLRLKVVAEGVETAEQLDMLRSQGCEAVQGYFFSRPLPAAELEILLRTQPFANR